MSETKKPAALAEQAEQEPVRGEWQGYTWNPYAISQPKAEQEPVALLHDDGYWTAAKTDAGRRLSERLLFAGSPSIAVYTAPQPAIPPGYKLVPEVPTNEWINNLAKTQTGPLEDVPFADIYRCIAELLDTAPEAPQPAKPAEQEPVAAQHRFRHPQKGTPDWSVWQPCKVAQRPAWEVDAQGYEVEYRALYTAPQPKREPLTDEEICAALDIDGSDDWTFKVAYAAIAAYERKNGGQP